MWKVNEWTLLSSCPSLPSLPVCPQERFWRDYSERIENFHLCAFFKTIIYLFIYFWLCWVPVSVPGFSLVAVSGGHSSSRCAGLSLSWPLLLRSTGSRRAGSVTVAHGPIAPRHVGSSQTRAWTRVPCIGRRILNHCATREALFVLFYPM